MSGRRVVKCRFKSAEAKKKAIQGFLREYGEDLPESVIRKSTAGPNLKRWVTYCEPGGRLAGIMRWEKSDWYLCTLKNAAVRKGLRSRGIGGKIYADTAKMALKDPGCLVLAADVTFDNYPSIRLLEKQGFDVVNRFCWERGKKPAEILHFVRVPPRGWVKGAC